MSEKPLVEIKNVSKRIGSRLIIDNLSLDIFRGEVLGFLGPNGAGKTTTIRMMLGLISITRGEIFIEGKSIRKDYEQAIAKVGGIVENPDMYKYLTGYQNLLHYARMYKGVNKERIYEVIKLVGLEQRIKDKVKTYSLGMRQRLGIAQALLNSPSLLVLDEPTNGLDPAGIHELRALLKKLAAEENIAVFVSSHLLSEMELMCTRVAIIQNGRLIQVQSLVDSLEDQKDKVLTIALDVAPSDKARLYLDGLNKNYNPVIKDNEIEIAVDREDIPGLIEMLVKEKYRIYGVREVQQSLEDKFLEATGGNQIV